MGAAAASDERRFVAGGPIPDSIEPLEIAIDLTRDEPESAAVARRLMAEQVGLIRAQRQSEQLGAALKLLTGLVGLAAAIAIGVMVLVASRSRVVVIEAFDAPPALAARGLSGQVVAGGVQDALTTIQTVLRTSSKKRQVSAAWTGDIGVEVPSTGLSIDEVNRLLRRTFGHDTHVSGALVQNRDGSLALTVRGTGILPRTFSGGPDSLPQLSVQAAEYVYGSAEPIMFTSYLAQYGRDEETIRFVEAAFPTAPVAMRAGLANAWGTALSTLGDDPGAAARYRLAIRLDPTDWVSWGNLVGTLWTLEGEESAYREGVRLQAAAEKRRRGVRPPDLADLLNWYPQVQDWSTVRDVTRANIAAAGGGDSLAIEGPVLADALTRLHDRVGADAALLASEADDPTTRAQKHFTPALFALMEQSRPAAALADMQAFAALWQTEPDVKFSFTDGPCFVGLAYALNGRPAEAAAAFARGGRLVACYAFQADALEAAGDRAGADAAYRRAVALAPSLPFAYQRWGLTLQRRGDWAGASAKFDAAHQRGPRWADPLKSQGDVLMQRGRRRDAAAKYAAALKLAPDWPALKAAAAAAGAPER